MSLHLYDTLRRGVREFVPLRPGKASVYLCGATVQAAPHIGHMRSGVNYDILIRWLRYRGFDVTFCRNITDIDDKIINVARDLDVPWWLVAERNQRAFARSYDLLGCLRPDIEPRATGHIPEMIVLMRRLIDAGHAYASGGDVCFDVKTWSAAYGELSNQKLENMRSACDTDTDDLKRDFRDFALWKSRKPGEPSWETPWGDGRPGWHLECSAMATKYLGAEFDIHGGGTDLVFPHHENELAQSRAAGDGFARYWVHHALLNVGAEKMSKSLGNSLLIPALLERVRAVELRYYLGQAHYRSVIDYSDEALHEAAQAYQRIEGFMTRACEIVVEPAEAAVLPPLFAEAMDDDLAVPRALAMVHKAVRDGNDALAAGDKDTAGIKLAETRAMLGLLGLDPLSEQWAETGAGHADVVGSLVDIALEQRQAARARKDYAAADAIRDQLDAAGIVVEDTPDGSRWELKR